MIFFLLLLTIAGAPVSGDDLRLSPTEQEAAYVVLESIDSDTDWRSLYSSDLCLSGPHGLVCDVFSSSVHITELNFGFVSDYSSNPSCSPNATLPPSLSSFPFLLKLFFYNCFSVAKASITPFFLSSLPSSLEELVFINNPALTGHLVSAAAYGSLPRLRRLILTGNSVSGRIPIDIGKLRTLAHLDLSRNLIHGPIPESIGNITDLAILDLSGNRISGPIPASIGRLGELLKLDLSSNRLSGPIPAGLSLLKKVELLDLSYNRLTGGVPTSLAEMASLKEVFLSGNRRLGGEIPEIWENLRGILAIGFSGIGLVGNIPPSMGVFLEKVSYLGLDRNYLEGQVPDQFRRLERTASEINVENNMLVGRIPFSAGFVERLGGNLKVGGNSKLCLDEEVAEHVRGMGRGSVGKLEKCNTTDIPHPVLFSSASVSGSGGCSTEGKWKGIIGIFVILHVLFC